jgi:hypothetical protein
MQVFDDFPTTAELQFTPANKSVSVVSPGGDFWVVPTAIMRFKFNDWTALMQGKGKLLLYGEAHYQDIFGNTHRSTWLYFWDTTAGGFIQGPLHNQAI